MAILDEIMSEVRGGGKKGSLGGKTLFSRPDLSCPTEVVAKGR